MLTPANGRSRESLSAYEGVRQEFSKPALVNLIQIVAFPSHSMTRGSQFNISFVIDDPLVMDPHPTPGLHAQP